MSVFTGGAVVGLAGGGFLTGMLGGAAIGATGTLLESAGNSLYFGDKFISAKNFAISVVASAAIGGTLSGISAVRQGQNFFKGSYVSIPKTPAPEPGQLSDDLIVDFPKNETQLAKPVSENPNISEIVHKIDEEIVDYEKIRRLADELGPHLRTPEVNAYKTQEINAVIESNGLKLEFRIESHNRLDKVFPDLNLAKDDWVRHMNVQLKQPVEGGRDIIIPINYKGVEYKNYHKLLDPKYLKKY